MASFTSVSDASASALTWDEMTKVKQLRDTNIQLHVGGKHTVRVGARSDVYSPKGWLLKKKKVKRITVNVRGT